MADIIPHPRARSERVVQTRIRGRLPKTIPSLWYIRSKKRMAEYEAQQIASEIEKFNESIGRANGYIEECKECILRLSQKRQGVHT